MWNIFEHWWTALLIAAVVQMALAIIHIVKPNSRKLWHILIPIAIIAAGITVERLVKTDFEKVNILLDTCTKAVARQDISAIESLLAPNYSDSCLTSKKAAMEYARRWLGRPLIKSLKLHSAQIEINRPTAEINFIVILHLDPKSDFAEMAQFPLLIKAKLYLGRNPDGIWLIDRAELLEINNQPFKWSQI
jgi:hypothetical protein